MLLEPVHMPDPLEGERPIELRPTLGIWLALEKAHGGCIGAIYFDARLGRHRLDVVIDLVHRCAREGGSSLTWSQIGERVHRLGLYRMHDLVLELFRDLYPPTPAAEDAKPEGDGIPLAGGA